MSFIERRRHIVYFGQVPDQGTGSPINMLRHLRRCDAAGWEVSVVGEWGQTTRECDRHHWPVHRLPLRRKWWPPFRQTSEVLREIRMILWAGECDRLLAAKRPDAILTYLSYHSDVMSEVAAHYSIRQRIPMTVIVYDDVVAFNVRDPIGGRVLGRRYRRILSRAHKRWFVSKELAEAYGWTPAPESVLMPMPEGTLRKATWRPDFASQPVIAYAGHIYSQQYPLLQRLGRMIAEAGGRLLLLTRERENLAQLCADGGIEFHPLFPTNEEALDYVGSRAAGFLAAYCDRVEDMPWIRSSFPSKIVEFGQLGLPILSVAPRDSAIFRWNAERALPYNFAPDEIRKVGEFVDALKNRRAWEALASSIQDLAQQEFNPIVIQQRLEKHLIGFAPFHYTTRVHEC